MADDVTIGIPTCDDDPAIFAKVLDAAVAQSPARPIRVVDMSHSGAISEIATSLRDSVSYHPAPSSSGVSDSRNRLAALCDTRYLVLVDADAVVDPGCVSALRDAFERTETAAVVGARCVAAWSGRRPPLFDTAPASDFLSLFDLGDLPRRVPRVMGTCYALDLTRVPTPPFSPELGRMRGRLLGAEEVQLCLNVQQQGWSVWYEPGSVVRHQIRAERQNWRWMLQRAYVGGQESRRTRDRLAPLPRTLDSRDRMFQALIALPYLVGRIRGLPRGFAFAKHAPAMRP